MTANTCTDFGVNAESPYAGCKSPDRDTYSTALAYPPVVSDSIPTLKLKSTTTQVFAIQVQLFETPLYCNLMVHQPCRKAMLLLQPYNQLELPDASNHV